MSSGHCEYETRRLTIGEWNLEDSQLDGFVQELLSPTVTAELPEHWQGAYSNERARQWIQEQDAESTVLLVQKLSREPAGLLILYPDERTVRIGYMLSEDHWGQGLATELISAFVDWCHNSDSFDEVVAGVGASNLASVRVLEKCGFVATGTQLGANIELVRSLTD